MDNLNLTTNLVNGILQYLGSRPYLEVSGLIQEIQKQAAAQGAKPSTPPADTPPVQ